MPAPDPTPLRDVLEALIRGAHYALLERDVDPSWMGPFTTELQQRLRKGSLTDVTAEFIRIIATSEEARTRQVKAGLGNPTEYVIAPAVSARPAALACIGLGCGAPVAGMLRRAGLRRWGAPFDWMTIPAEAVRDCLVDDFTLLMLPQEHEPLPEEERPPGQPGHLCRHRRLSEMYGPTLFHHHDPTTEAGFGALERAVLRLRDSLRGLHRKMLVQVTEEGPTTREVFADTADFLDRTARGAMLVCIAVVEGRPEGPFPEIELSEAFGPHRLLRCRLVGGAEGISFTDPLDEVVLLRAALAAPQQTRA